MTGGLSDIARIANETSNFIDHATSEHCRNWTSLEMVCISLVSGEPWRASKNPFTGAKMQVSNHFHFSKKIRRSNLPRTLNYASEYRRIMCIAPVCVQRSSHKVNRKWGRIIRMKNYLTKKITISIIVDEVVNNKMATERFALT